MPNHLKKIFKILDKINRANSCFKFFEPEIREGLKEQYSENALDLYELERIHALMSHTLKMIKITLTVSGCYIMRRNKEKMLDKSLPSQPVNANTLYLIEPPLMDCENPERGSIYNVTTRDYYNTLESFVFETTQNSSENSSEDLKGCPF